MKQPPSHPLISFRKLQGGQFGTLDVSSLGQNHTQFELGSGDFVRLNRRQWIALRSMLDRFFNCERETVVIRSEAGEDVVFEEREREVVRANDTEVEAEIEEARAPVRKPAKTRPRRRAAAAG